MPSTNGHGAKQAILFARVSTDEQARSGYSLAQQLEALRGTTLHAKDTRFQRRYRTPARAERASSVRGWTA
jgi:DNA invertase Pin-like site-specific DNA recombinase